jgi:hypothetical protein
MDATNNLLPVKSKVCSMIDIPEAYTLNTMNISDWDDQTSMQVALTCQVRVCPTDIKIAGVVL